MSRNAIYIRILLVVMVLAVLVSFLGRTTRQAPSDSWLPSSLNPVGAGSLAFYDTLEDLNWPVSRWREPFGRLAAQGDDNVLIVTRSPVSWRVAFTTQEAGLLDAWVRRGNTLLLFGSMAKWDDTRELLHRFGFDVPKPEAAPRFLPDLQSLGTDNKVEATTEANATGKLILPESAVLPPEYPQGAKVLWSNGGSPAVIELAYGKGRVVCVASAEMLDNRYLDEGDNLAILLRLIAPDGHAPRHLFFEESHHGFTATFALARLIDHPGVRLALVLAVLGAVSFFGSTFVRFGPVLPLDREPGRSSLEFIDSIAELYRHADLRDETISFLFQETHRQVIARLNLPAAAPHELIASRLKRAHPELPSWKKLAHRFDSHDYVAGLPPGGWLRVARELIQIKNALA